MCGVCQEITNPSMTPSMVAMAFAGVSIGGQRFLKNLRDRIVPSRRRAMADHQA